MKKKKIGILTFHRAINYGAILQCYALQQFLLNEGCEVEVVDYRQPAIEKSRRIVRLVFFLKCLLRNLRYALIYLYRTPQRVITKVSFDFFVSRFLNLSKSCSEKTIPKDYDIYIIGSDQLWNQGITRMIDSVYWGHFDTGEAKLITYAISSSMKDFMKIDCQYVYDSLKHFSAISCREKRLCNYINDKIKGGNAIQVLDPTLIVDRSIWEMFDEKSFSRKSYVLLHHAGRIGSDKVLYKKANEMASLLGCEVLNVTQKSYSIEQFVSLFRYAKCVVTTSFHAVAFSLIFERPLCAMILHDGHDDRYVDLLTTIGAKALIVEVDFEPRVSNFDYAIVRPNLDALIEKSRLFLRNQIQERSF